MGEEKKEEVKEEKEKEAQEIVLKVDMHCEACARKVTRSLKGFEDCKSSKVVVKGKTADPIKVSERIQRKTGRKVVKNSPLPKSPEENKEEKEEKKEEPPAVITVALNVRMHCEACGQLLQKQIRKIQGVETVKTDVSNDEVIVKGVVDRAKLVDDVYNKTGKQVSIVKEEEKEGEEDKKGDNKRNEYWSWRYYMEYQYAYPQQIFSDENPNAFSVM